MRDVDAGGAHQLDRLGFAEQAQRAEDLLHRTVKLAERRALLRIAEEVVQRLLDLRQAGQHLLCQLREGFALVRACAAVAGCDGLRCQGFAAAQRGQARQRGIRFGSQAGVGRAGRDRALDLQQYAGHLEGDAVGELQRIVAQPAGEIDQAADQPLDTRAGKAGGRPGELAEFILEMRQGDRRAGAEGVPLHAHRAQPVAQRLQQGCEGDFADARARRRQQRVEPPAGADGTLLLGRRRRRGDVIEDFAQQPFGRCVVAAHQAAELRVDLRAQFLHARVSRDGAGDQRVEEAQAGPPQRPRRACGLQRLDRGDRLAHLGCAVAGGALAQPLEQAALEASARAAQHRLRLVGGRRRFITPRRAQAEVGVEQLERAARGLAARRRDRVVERRQAQGLVGHALHQFLEVVAERGQRAQPDAEAVPVGLHHAACHVAEQQACRFGELGESVEPDDGECPAHLVQVSLRELHADGRVAGAAGLLERFPRARKRGVDLALDPVQRPEIRFDRICHECSRRWHVARCVVRP